jgi:DmsE family decaheme c-type cytochrome
MVVQFGSMFTTTIRTNRVPLLWLLLILVAAIGCKGQTRATNRRPSETAAYGPNPKPRWQEQEYAVLRVPVPQIADAEYIDDDELCMTCHEAYVKTFQHNVHKGQSCEKCHGPGSRHVASRGREPGSILSFKSLTPPQRAELCLQCHEQNSCAPGTQWRTSPHAHRGVSCTDCHTSHYNVPPGTPSTLLAENATPTHAQLVSYRQSQPLLSDAEIRAQSKKLGALSPNVCYRCHSNMERQEHIGHSHQICGAVGFDCATCHDPHGKLRPESRTDLCLTCHDTSSPTMAWHSSTHARYGVACADCHNPHPKSDIQQVLNIQHTHIQRQKRGPMSVSEPQVCYKCHPDIYAKTSMPSHHPIKEGKMVCSDCHDAHGQSHTSLKEPTTNLMCYKCHAEKQGPFAYEHPPVTENCGICHDPHGTVANNLLHQPTTFLCLRCHSGHRTGSSAVTPGFPSTHPGGAQLADVGVTPSLQRAYYTDCSQCHSQIHGSDVPSPHLPHAFMR